MHLLAPLRRHLPELLGLAAGVWVQFQFSRWLLEHGRAGRSPAVRRLLRTLTVLLAVWVMFGVAGSLPMFYRVLPSSPVLYWTRGAAMAWCLASLGAFVILVRLLGDAK